MGGDVDADRRALLIEGADLDFVGRCLRFNPYLAGTLCFQHAFDQCRCQGSTNGIGALNTQLRRRLRGGRCKEGK
ncbi:hypothetical protein D3C84_1015880 [compost metagenome]